MASQETTAVHSRSLETSSLNGFLSRRLILGSASVELALPWLNAGLQREMDYLLSGFHQHAASGAPEIRIQRGHHSGEFQLTHLGRVEARSQEPRELLPWTESLIHALILEQGTGDLMFHGAAAARGDRALWLSGPSGSGKSTLCAALLSRPGFSFVADDTVLWDLHSAALRPYPRPMRLKLKDGSLFERWKDLGIQFGVDYLDSDLWYLSPFHEFENHPPADLGSGMVVHCTYRPHGEPRLERQCRAQGLCELLENVHQTPGFTAAEIFSETADLASRFTFYGLTYRDCHRAARLIEELLDSDD